MFFRTLFILFTCTCVDASILAICDNVPIEDPCSCHQQHVFLSVNYTAQVGTAVAVLNVSTGVTLDPCDYFNLTSGQLILVKDLSTPSCAVSPQNCQLNCQSNLQKTLVVNLIHIDENVPEFPNTTFFAYVFENATKSTIVFSFKDEDHKPVDKDCPADKSFNYFTQNNEVTDIFDFVTGTSGDVVLKKSLDYEKLTDHTFNITVAAQTVINAALGSIGYTTLIIIVEDVDDNDPQFEHLEYDLDIREETISTTPIFGKPIIRAFDRDKGVNQTILYSFEDYKNTSDFLKISPTDATFTVINMVDRERNSSYIMTIWCFQSDNWEKKASGKLNIHVCDINDNLPIFDPVTYNVTLVENAVGYVTTVTATDLDFGDNAEIFYEMVDPKQLDINPNSGIVTVRPQSDLDREDSPVITALIKAKDKDGNYSTTTATVSLTLLDVNDNSPQFVEEFFVFHVNTTGDGDVVGRVNATDADEQNTPNANVTYDIQAADVPFVIDTHTGMLAIHGAFDRQKDYAFFVIACDNPDKENDRRCSIGNLAVLYGKNISFDSYNIELYVLENMPIGTMFGQVLPIYGDSYVCSLDEFTVDVQSVLMKTKTKLDRESNQTYEGYIEVYQYNQPIGNISFTIHVQDDNDNAPRFTQEEYFFSISADFYNEHLVGKLNATDEDIHENANLTFSFQQRFIDLFTIDLNTGEVMKSDQWKEDTVVKNSLYQLIAVVEDRGTPSLRSVVPVYISSMEVGLDFSVGIPTTLSKDTLMEANTKEAIERKLAEILGFDTITITDVDEATSLVYIKASVNETDVTAIDLQRSLVNNWSPIQNMFRQYMVPLVEIYHSDNGLSTAEIALIAMSVVLFFGGIVAIIVISRQWDAHIKSTRLYDSLRRPSNMYDSQELRMDFSEEELPSRFSTFKGPGKRNEDITMDGSFGLGFANAAFNADGEELNTPTTPTWSCNDTPRIPRWSTSDSLKDAMASLEELTNRLNNEDNISRVSNMSRGRRSVKSTKSDPQTPRSEVHPETHIKDGRTVPGYENLVLNSATAKDYEDLNLGERTVNGEYTNRGYSESEKSASERIQEIIENNVISDGFENTDIDKLVNDDLIEEESTAF